METVRFKVDTRFLYTLRVSKISYNNRQEKWYVMIEFVL